jgi:two-component system sensor histidine kinase DegS
MNSPHNGGEGDVIAEIESEFKMIQSRVRENKALFDQTSAEVKKWEQENVRTTSNLRRIQEPEAFATSPRADIRVAYDEAMEAKTRLLTMRGQMEKLEENQSNLEQYGGLLERVLQRLKGFNMPGASPSASRQDRIPLSLAGQQIIRIVQAQEDERQTLANQLHDGPAQSLTNFILQAEVCERLFNRDPDRASVELRHLKEAASSSFQKVRDFIFDLRPMMLDDLGLIPTLNRYAEYFQQKFEVELQFNHTGEERRIATYTEVMTFRSIQSLLVISRDYLMAQTIKLMVDLGTDFVKASVEDDGQGFDPEIDLDPNQGDSNVQRLNSIRERVELIGGTMEIFSEEGAGSQFQIVLPIRDEEDFG